MANRSNGIPGGSGRLRPYYGRFIPERQGQATGNPDPPPVEMYQSGEWSDENVREFIYTVEDVVGGDAFLFPECNEGVM
jgi:hypothetical protein